MQPKIQYKRDNLIVDEIYWLHPDDGRHIQHNTQVRICQMRDKEIDQVNIYPLYGGSVQVQAPLVHIQEMATHDAEFQKKLHHVPSAEMMTELQWFTKHLQSLKAQIVDDQIVTDYPLRKLNSGSVHVHIKSTGETQYYSLFRDLFMVWHIMRNTSNSLVWVCSLKDRDGWEITQI
jgi:hypothetical protein